MILVHSKLFVLAWTRVERCVKPLEVASLTNSFVFFPHNKWLEVWECVLSSV